MKPKLDYKALNLTEETLKPSQTFVVLTGGEKQEILNPEVVGPFESPYEAYAWVAQLPNASVAKLDSHWPGAILLRPHDGGYAGFAIVNSHISSDPKEYLQSAWELYDDEEGGPFQYDPYESLL